MPVPPYVASLRAKIGQELLWLTGLSAVVLDDAGRVLLTERRDNGEWALPSGILEPGEQPARAIVREIAEETCVQAEVVRLSSVVSDSEPYALPNGDVCQYLNLSFACRYLSGQAAVGDDENTAVAWFAPHELPPMNQRNRDRLRRALEPTEDVYFLR